MLWIERQVYTFLGSHGQKRHLDNPSRLRAIEQYGSNGLALLTIASFESAFGGSLLIIAFFTLIAGLKAVGIVILIAGFISLFLSLLRLLQAVRGGKKRVGNQ